MTADTDLVVVRKSYLNFLRNHCDRCPNLSVQQRTLLRENHVEIPYKPSPCEVAPKRKTTQKPPGNERSKHLKSSKGQPKKLRARDSFVLKIPKASQWRRRQESVVGETNYYEGLVRSLTRCSKVDATGKPNQGVLKSTDRLVLVGEKLALLTDASLKANALQRSFSYFQAFLFLSYCGLLESRGISYEVVDRLTQYISSFREVDRRRLRSQALRVNILVQELVERGWNICRATELFFLNPLSPTYLLSVDEEGFQHILETLTTDEYLKYGFDDCFRPEYTIPGLITYMIHEANASTTISTDEICAGLRYKHVIIPEPLDHILRVRHSIQSKAEAPISFVFATNGDSYQSQVQPSPHRKDGPKQNKSDQELSTGLQVRQRHQLSEEHVSYYAQHATDDVSAWKAPYFGGHAGNPGPQLQLPIQIRVPDTAQSVWFAMKGDINGLKYLFSLGLATPRDVSHSRGFSLVMWALYGGMHNYETVQFLLSQGAFVDENSYQHVWDYAYRMKCSSTELAELQCITLNPPSTYAYRDWTDEQHFPLIHNIIFGRSSKQLRAELDDNPDAVYVTDAMGRTALDWATALARWSDMKLLIDRGSPLDTMDVSGRTTILHAVDSHNDDALRIILEAGANPNPEVPEGLFRSSPLTAASFGGLAEMIKLLIKFGAKVDGCNPEGRTPLQAVVASMQDVECADILLTHGADLGSISSNGHSPLTTAITYNNHAMLKLFINRCDTSHQKGLQLLPIIAKSADAGTMSILASSDFLRQTLPNRDFVSTGHETLRSRTDYDEKLGNAFEDLCRHVERI